MPRSQTPPASRVSLRDRLRAAWCALSQTHRWRPPRARLRVNDVRAGKPGEQFRWTLFVWWNCERCDTTRTMELDFSDWRSTVEADVWDTEPVAESRKTHAGQFQA